MFKTARILIFSLVSITTCSQYSLASERGVERGEYTCSNNQTYDVATYYSDGWGSNTRFFIGFCRQGVIKNRFYNSQDPEDINDISDCNDEESEAKKFCMEEFLILNPIDENALFLNQNIGASIENLINSNEPRVVSKKSLTTTEATRLLNKKLMSIPSQDVTKNAFEMNKMLAEMNLPTIDHEAPELMVDLSHSIGISTSKVIGASFDDGIHKFCLPCEVGHNNMLWGIYPYIDALK